MSRTPKKKTRRPRGDEDGSSLKESRRGLEMFVNLWRKLWRNWTMVLLLLVVGLCSAQWTAPKRGAVRQVRVPQTRNFQRDAHPGAQYAGLDSLELNEQREDDDARETNVEGSSGEDSDNSFSTGANDDEDSASSDEHQLQEGIGDEVAQEGSVDEANDEARGYAYAVEFIEPRDGDVISSTPFRVTMQTTGGFSVPADGEILLTMTYPGRGQDIRVLQSTEFRSWNIVGGDFTITAMLVTTKDEPRSAPVSVHVKQERGVHFVVQQPEDGQLLLARAAVPIVVNFGGLVPAGSRACFDLESAPPPPAAPQRKRVCTDDPESAALVRDQQGGALRVEVPLPPGNCSLRAAVYDASDNQLSPETLRHFRVVDEQDECPPGSGIACLHGHCHQARCVCDYGAFGGTRCAPPVSRKKESRASAAAAAPTAEPAMVSLADAYLHLVKAALLDKLYAKDRPGETLVVARSMVGQQGLDDLQALVEAVIADGVAGDLMETGVWQGGSCMLMAAVLKAHNESRRKVWVVDSFEGCPPPDPDTFPQDAQDKHHTYTNLQVSIHKVTSNFADFGLEGTQIEMVKGWFRDSIFSDRIQAIEAIALLRLDGDLYQSTIEVLRGVYFKVAIGGFVVVDDWRLDGMQARSAVIDFHRECQISETIHVGGDGLAWWRKLSLSACG